MKLPNPPPRYDQSFETRRNGVVEQEDLRNRKKGTDVELDKEKLILRSPNGARWQLVVSNAGIVSAVAVP